jgi:hypothetical protein
VELSKEDDAIFIWVSSRSRNERDLPFFSKNEDTAVFFIMESSNIELTGNLSDATLHSSATREAVSEKIRPIFSLSPL